jgi:hypothetical protein
MIDGHADTASYRCDGDDDRRMVRASNLRRCGDYSQPKCINPLKVAITVGETALSQEITMTAARSFMRDLLSLKGRRASTEGRCVAGFGSVPL